jgi:hypothetical protein
MFNPRNLGVEPFILHPSDWSAPLFPNTLEPLVN